MFVMNASHSYSVYYLPTPYQISTNLKCPSALNEKDRNTKKISSIAGRVTAHDSTAQEVRIDLMWSTRLLEARKHNYLETYNYLTDEYK